MRVVGECFFWYRLTRVFPDKFHRAVKRLCGCVCVCLHEAIEGEQDASQLRDGDMGSLKERFKRVCFVRTVVCGYLWSKCHITVSWRSQDVSALWQP